MEKKNLIALIAVVAFGFTAGLPLLHSGLHPTHDGEYHVVRFAEFYKNLQYGTLYPRWAPTLNFGLGVPLFNYVYPFPNYVASLMHLMSMSFIDAFKLNLFLALIFSGVFFYLWTKRFWGVLGGIVSSVFYMYAPYHFLDIYIRGSVGEVWALAFYPAFLWSITQFVDGKKEYFGVSAIFFSLIIFSHNILALLFFPVSITYILFLSKKDSKRIFMCFGSIAIGIMLSAIFWLPALVEKKYVVGLEIYDIGKNFPELYQLIIPSWGSGFSEGPIDNQMSFQIGIPHILSVLISIPLIFWAFFKKKKHAFVSFWALSLFFIAFFLMLQESKSVWNTVPFLNYVQFPWRLLSVVILVASFLIGLIIHTVKFERMVALILLVFCFLYSIGYTKPAYYHDRKDDYYLVRPNFIDGTNSPGNYFNTIWVKGILKRQDNPIKSTGSIKVFNMSKSPTKYTFELSSSKKQSIEVAIAYFPGWEVSINKEKSTLGKSDRGTILLQVPKGSSSIELAFRDTLIRQIGTIISVLGVLTLIGFSWYAKITR